MEVLILQGLQGILIRAISERFLEPANSSPAVDPTQLLSFTPPFLITLYNT